MTLAYFLCVDDRLPFHHRSLLVSLCLSLSHSLSHSFSHSFSLSVSLSLSLYPHSKFPLLPSVSLFSFLSYFLCFFVCFFLFLSFSILGNVRSSNAAANSLVAGYASSVHGQQMHAQRDLVWSDMFDENEMDEECLKSSHENYAIWATDLLSHTNASGKAILNFKFEHFYS